MFNQPSAGGDRVDIKELVGSLVLVWVREVRENVPTPYGESDAVACDIHVLDGAKGGEKFENTLLFQRALIGSLRSFAGGEPVLGRVGTGIAKPGQSAPYILNDFTDQDAAVATGYIQRMKPGFKAPSSNGSTAPSAVPSAPAAPVSLDISTLDPSVVELLRQTGVIPA